MATLTWDGLKKYLAGQWPEYIPQSNIALHFEAEEKLVSALLTMMTQAGETETNAKEGNKNAAYRINHGSEAAVVEETLEALAVCWSLVAALKQRTKQGEKVEAVMKKFGKWKGTSLKTVLNQGPGSGRGGNHPAGKLSQSYNVLAALRDLGGEANIEDVAEKLTETMPMEMVTVQKALSNLRMQPRGYVETISKPYPAVYKITPAGYKYLEAVEAKESNTGPATKTRIITKPSTGHSHLYEVINAVKQLGKPTSMRELVAKVAVHSPLDNKQAGKIMTAASRKGYLKRIGDDLPARYNITKSGQDYIKAHG